VASRAGSEARVAYHEAPIRVVERVVDVERAFLGFNWVQPCEHLRAFQRGAVHDLRTDLRHGRPNQPDLDAKSAQPATMQP